MTDLTLDIYLKMTTFEYKVVYYPIYFPDDPEYPRLREMLPDVDPAPTTFIIKCNEGVVTVNEKTVRIANTPEDLDEESADFYFNMYESPPNPFDEEFESRRRLILSSLYYQSSGLFSGSCGEDICFFQLMDTIIVYLVTGRDILWMPPSQLEFSPHGMRDHKDGIIYSVPQTESEMMGWSPDTSYSSTWEA